MRKAIRVSALILTLACARALAAPGGDAKMLTASGNVSKVQAADRTVFVAVSDGPEMRFSWTADTKINGTLAVGARVSVRYTVLPDGQNLAHQISVGR